MGEVKCLLCGFSCGQIVGGSFRPAAGVRIPSGTSLARIRCPRCGGSVYVEEDEGPYWLDRDSGRRFPLSRERREGEL